MASKRVSTSARASKPNTKPKAAAPAPATTRQELPPPPVQGAFRVRATALGYYQDRRRRPGDEFMVEPKAFSAKWMEHVDGGPPVPATSGAARRAHQKAVKEATRPGTVREQLGGDDDEGDDATGAKDVLS